MSNEIIKLAKISKKFVTTSKNITVLKNINLKINSGELVSLTGPSGSGKSTLLHIIALLDQPTSGEVFFKRKSFSKSNDSEKDLVRRKGISIIYQQNNLLSDFTAIENVSIPLVNNGYSWSDSIKKAVKILSLVNLSQRLNHFPSELSGGEQQRVAIARALINDPEVILADEPTGNLDPEISGEIIRLLMDISKSGKAVIVATHDYAHFSKYPSKTIKCENGKVVIQNSQ